MNVVWPLTMLWSGPIGLYYYFKVGRLGTARAIKQSTRNDQRPQSKPFRQIVGVAASHCGAGCTLGDLLTEWVVSVAPLTLFGNAVAATWVMDYVVAFLFGVAFQYYTIKPMRKLSVRQGLAQAIKADALSITAWQIGMYGWMAIAIFGIFDHEIPQSDPVFWFMMQIAMFAGFATAFPVNWVLLERGVKEKM